MELLTVKLLSMLGIGLLALFFGLLPLKVKKLILKGEEHSKKRRRRENIISCLLCFGAGVLIATVFMHMLPETREGFEKAQKMGLLGGHKSHPETGTLTQPKDHLRVIHNKNDISNRSYDHTDYESHNHDHNVKQVFQYNQENKNNNEDHHNHDDHHNPGDREDVSDQYDILEIKNNHNHDENHQHDHHDEATNFDYIGHNLQDDHVDHDHNEHELFRLTNEASKTKLNDVKLSKGLSTSNNPDVKVSPDYLLLEEEKDDIFAIRNLPLENPSVATTADEVMSPVTDISLASTSSSTSENTELPLVISKLSEVESIHENMINTLNEIDPSDLLKAVELIKTQSRRKLHHENDHYHHHHSQNDPHFQALMHKHDDHRSHDDQRDRSNQSDHSGHNHDEHQQHLYPFAELTVCLGFFFIYLIEEVVHKVFFKNSGDSYEDSNTGNQHGHSHSHSHVRTTKVSENKVAPDNEARTPPITSDAYPMETNHTFSKGHSEWCVGGIDNPVFAGDVDATGWNPKIKNTLLSNSKVLTITDDVVQNGLPSSGVTNGMETGSNNPVNEDVTKSKEGLLATVQNLLIVLAIGFHAIFEGMAIGLQENQTDVWYLTFAISAHKFIIMFCVGLELLKDDTSKFQMVMSTVVLALITPLGTAIGIIVTENTGFGGSEHILVVSILQGLAGGTLLYVAFLEILERERSKSGARFMKFFSLIVGFGFMCLLEVFGGHSH